MALMVVGHCAAGFSDSFEDMQLPVHQRCIMILRYRTMLWAREEVEGRRSRIERSRGGGSSLSLKSSLSSPVRYGPIDSESF